MATLVEACIAPSATLALLLLGRDFLESAGAVMVSVRSKLRIGSRWAQMFISHAWHYAMDLRPGSFRAVHEVLSL